MPLWFVSRNWARETTSRFMSTIVKVFYLVSLYNDIFISSVHIKAVSSLILFLILSESFVFYTSLHVTLRKWAQSNFGCKIVPKPEENKQVCLKTFKWLYALIYTNTLWFQNSSRYLFPSLLLVSYSLYFCLSSYPPPYLSLDMMLSTWLISCVVEMRLVVWIALCDEPFTWIMYENILWQYNIS